MFNIILYQLLHCSVLCLALNSYSRDWDKFSYTKVVYYHKTSNKRARHLLEHGVYRRPDIYLNTGLEPLRSLLSFVPMLPDYVNFTPPVNSQRLYLVPG